MIQPIDRETVIALADLWDSQWPTYPRTPEGIGGMVAVKLCAKELREAVANSRKDADKLLQQALEALDNSVDTVREEYTEAVRRYSGLPSRKARLDALNSLLTKHEASIVAIRTYLENKT